MAGLGTAHAARGCARRWSDGAPDTPDWPSLPNLPLKYIAELQAVRELGLVGSADPQWWCEHLEPEGLEPVLEEEAAQVVLTGLTSSYWGIAFVDVSVAIPARSKLDGRTGYYFPCAANASSLFAFFEKHWFKTPYEHRTDLVAEFGESHRIGIGRGEGAEVFAELGAGAEESAPREDFAVEVPLFLPTRRSRDPKRWFGVRLLGNTRFFTFEEGRDRFHLAPSARGPIPAILRSSSFQPRTWHLRLDASHARSKTLAAPR